MSTWKDKGYDDFMIRKINLYGRKEPMGGLEDGLLKTTYPDSSVPSLAIGAGPFVGQFEVSSGYIQSVGYEGGTAIGSGWRLNSDGTVEGINVSRMISVPVISSLGDITEQNGVVGVVIPATMDGMNLTAAICAVHTLGGVGFTHMMIRRKRDAAEVDMLSSVLKINAQINYSSTTCTIDTDNDDIATGDVIYIDIDQTTFTPAKGLTVTLTFS